MRKIKSVVALVLTLVLTLSLAGCGETKKAEAAVVGMFEAFKISDLSEAQKYIDIENVTAGDANGKAFLEIISKNLSYEIVSSEKIDSSNVVVKAKVTATDMELVMNDYLAKVVDYTFSTFSNPQSEEEMNKRMQEILIECGTAPGLATITSEVDIKVVKNNDNEWRVESDSALGNALLGGYMDSVNETEDIF